MNPENLWINSAITLCAIAVTFFVILYFMRLEGKKKNIKPNSIVAFIDKYSLVFGVVFIIVGLALWIPILNGSESMFWFEPKRVEYDFPPAPELIPPNYEWNSTVPPYILILEFAYFNTRYFVFTSLGFLSLIIGLSFIRAYVFRGIKKWIARPK
ncbi:hypothetical protein ES703_47875 [subsurface metagenome]